MSNPTTDIALDDLLTLARRGFHIFPCKDKAPIAKRGVKDATTDPATIRKWFARWPTAGWAINCGASGLLVVDVDPPQGPIALEVLEAKHGTLPPTLTVRTPRGGTHYYSAAPDGVKLSPSVGKIGTNIDIRAGASYVLAPPTENYFVDDPDTELPDRAKIADAPDWLVDFAHSKVRDKCYVMHSDDYVHYVPLRNTSDDTPLPVVCADLDEAIRRSKPEHIGQRRARLFHFARCLKSMPEYTNADPESMRDIVRRWWTCALPNIGTKPFDDSWMDFIEAWPAAWPLTEDKVMIAMKNSKQKPLPQSAKRYDCPTIHRLLALCAELQREAGEAPFYLSCGKAQEVLDVDRMSVWRRLRLLERDGILKMDVKGDCHRATTYFMPEVIGGDPCDR